MKKCFPQFFLLVLFLINIDAYAIVSGNINGKVIDIKTGEELIGVTILVEGTSLGAVTDFEGKYHITGVSPGTYKLVASYISYNKKIISGVEVKPKETISLSFSMEVASKDLNEFVVVAELKKESQSALMIQQKNAVSVSDGISADAIKKTPDKSASEVLKRISGASIQDNKFAVIRGLNERYTSAYINGAPLPSSESDKKAFSFDIFPSNLLDNIVVTKTATPDMPGEFGGGIIEINTKSIPTENFNTFSVSGGYNTMTTFKNQLTYKGGGLDWLGVDDGTRALPSAIPDDKNFPVSIKEQAELGKSMKNDWALTNTKFSPNYGFQYTFGHSWGKKNNQIGTIIGLTYNRTNAFTTTRRKQYDSNYDPNIPVQQTEDYLDENYSTQTLTGLMANLGYKINGNNEITFKNLYSINADDKVISRTGTAAPLDENPMITHSTAMWFTSSKIYSGQLSGSHYLSTSKIKINWIGAYSQIERDIPNLRRNSYSKFTRIQDPNNPDIPDEIKSKDTIYKANIAQSNVGPDYAGNIFYSNTKERIYSFKSDVSHQSDIKSIFLKNNIKIGGSYQLRERDFTARQLGYVKYAPPGNLMFPDSILYLPEDKIFSPQYMGQSSNGYGGFALSNKYKPTDSYTAKSNLLACFIMFDQRFRDRYRLIWGVRAEKFVQDLYFFLDNSTPLNISSTKVDYLPSVNLVISLTQNQNIRLGYSQTVNRPEFRELAPFAFYDFASRFVISGNPAMTRALIHNYDLRYEWFPGRGQIFTSSLFYKDFVNPIEQIMRQDVSNEITYSNLNKAKVYGAEFEFRVLLGELFKSKATGFLNNLTVYSNLTLTRSEVDLVTNNNSASYVIKSRPLQGQSPYIINCGIQYFSYETGWSFSTSYNKVGPRIYIVGTANEPDIWENGRDMIDIQIGKSFLKNKMEARLNIKDLLAQNHYFFQDNNHNSKLDVSSDNLIWVTNYGQTCSMSLSYKF